MNPTVPTIPAGKLTPQQISSARSSLSSTTTNNSSNDSFGIDTTPQPTLVQRMGSDIKDTGNEISDEISGTGNYAGDNSVTRGFEAAGSAVGGAMKTASEVLPQPIREGLGAVNKGASDVVNWLGDKLGSTKLAQDFVTQHPDAANTLGQIAKVASSAGTVAGGILTAGSGAEIGNQVISKVGDIGSGATAEAVAANTTGPIKIGVEDTTPEYTPKAASNSPLQVEENTKVTGGRKMISTEKDIAAGNETVDNYPKNGTNLQKAQAVLKQIKTEAQSNEAALDAEKITRPPQEVKAVIKSAVHDAADESVLLQKSDPVVKNYLRVANKLVDQNEGTLKGELKVRQGLDDAYESAGGKYGNNKALDQIHRAARDAVTEDTASHAKSTDLKASLKRQTNLYHAADILSDKAAGEAESRGGRFLDKHPVLKSTARIGSRVAQRTIAGTAAREIVKGVGSTLK